MTERPSLTTALSDRYEIEREVGDGGMATVYLARDIKHARQVALKVLHPDLAAALGPERFLAEIRTTANLQHPHILPLHDSGDADRYLFDFPSWSRDGRRIFYRVPGAYRVATIDVSGATPRLARDDSLFADDARKNFDVHPDGKRFAVIRDAGEAAKLIVVTHWLDDALVKLRQQK